MERQNDLHSLKSYFMWGAIQITEVLAFAVIILESFLMCCNDSQAFFQGKSDPREAGTICNRLAALDNSKTTCDLSV